MNTNKLARNSIIGSVYQIEHTVSRSIVSEYRVRRGSYGGWSPWFKTSSIPNTLNTLGFMCAPQTEHDFAFESLLSRGKILLSKAAVTELVNTIGENTLSQHVYSRVKKLTDDTWFIPSSTITDELVYNFVLSLIRRHQC